MHSPSNKTQGLARAARRHWLLLTIAGLAFVALLAGQPAFAADVRPHVNQTVPPPTPRPSSDNNNNNNNNNNDNNDNNNDSNNQSDTSGAASSQTEAPTAVVTETAPAAGALTAVVQVVSLNVRQGPATTYPVSGKLAEGTEITVEGRNEAGDWWYICCIAGGDARGWVSAALVTPSFAADQAAALPVVASEAAPAATPAPSTTAATTATTTGGVQGTVAGVNLNVRSGPSTDDTVLGKLRGSDTVTVLGRNAGGDWLYICCIGTPPSNGWVSAQFITPAFAAGELPEVGSDGQAGTGAGTSAAGGTEASTATGEGTQAGAATGTGALSVAIAQQPPFAVQGREIALIYTVSNDGSEDLTDVVLSSELPTPLSLIAATAGSAGEVNQTAGSPAVTATWATLPAGASVSATVRVRVADDIPNGTTFANLASVTAGNGETASTGITIGMPPSLLPEFW
jgi:uncharacterized protein YgiM (DUF1202 family)